MRQDSRSQTASGGGPAMRRTIMAVLGLVVAAMLPAAAQAQQSSRSYRVEANSEYWVDLNLCAPSIEFTARGDGDTDVDFTIYDTNNNVVYQDLALNDVTTTTLRPPAGGDRCVTWRLKLNNLGDVWNQVTVEMSNTSAVVPRGKTAAPTYLANTSYRVEATSIRWVDLNLCSPRVTVEVTGDGDTDVDFTIYDASNNVMYSDVDLDDRTVAVLRPPAGNGRCVIWKLKLNNLGNVWNQVTVNVR